MKPVDNSDSPDLPFMEELKAELRGLFEPEEIGQTVVYGSRRLPHPAAHKAKHMPRQVIDQKERTVLSLPKRRPEENKT